MTKYKDINSDSGISKYKIDEDKITIEFKGGSTYLYTYTSAGSTNIEKMKLLAQNGDGLNSFINKNVRTKYEKKLI